MADRVEFVVGDAHALDFAAASFDAVVAYTLLSHVRDPLAVLRRPRAWSVRAVPWRSSTATTRR